MTTSPVDQARRDLIDAEARATRIRVRSNIRPLRPLVSFKKTGEEMMSETNAPHTDATRPSTTAGEPNAAGAAIGSKRTTEKAPKIEGSHTQETVDPAERLPDEPEKQNDLA